MEHHNTARLHTQALTNIDCSLRLLCVVVVVVVAVVVVVVVVVVVAVGIPKERERQREQRTASKLVLCIRKCLHMECRCSCAVYRLSLFLSLTQIDTLNNMGGRKCTYLSICIR